jgi:Arc/MetJ-type ribon-helix-helix transcriptional regulator
MKQKLSITVDEEKIKLIEEMLKEGLFRSKSHVVEYSLAKFLKERQTLRSQNEYS